MNYGGESDFKRSRALDLDGRANRRPVHEEPGDFDLSHRQESLRASLDSSLRQIKVLSVWFPSLATMFLGLLLVWLGPAASAWESVGVGAITTGIAVGCFRWGQEIALASASSRKLRTQLSMNADLGFCDLSGVELPDAYLRSRRLAGAKFSAGNFRNADLRGAELTDARFTNADFFDSKFQEADLTSAGLYDAKLRRCDFSDATLKRAVLVKADLTGSKLDNVDLRCADLRRAVLSDASLEDARFSDTWYSADTKWPIGFDPKKKKGLVLVEDRAARPPMDLRTANGSTPSWIAPATPQ